MKGKNENLRGLYDAIYKKAGDGKGKIYLTENLYLLSDGEVVEIDQDEAYRERTKEQAKNSPNIYGLSGRRVYVGDGYSKPKSKEITDNEFFEL